MASHLIYNRNIVAKMTQGNTFLHCELFKPLKSFCFQSTHSENTFLLSPLYHSWAAVVSIFAVFLHFWWFPSLIQFFLVLWQPLYVFKKICLMLIRVVTFLAMESLKCQSHFMFTQRLSSLFLLSLFCFSYLTTSICQVGVGIVWVSTTEDVVTH